MYVELSDNLKTRRIKSQYSNYILKKIDHFFHITKRRSSIAKEIRGGLITFLTMCYIIVANPGILEKSNIEQKYSHVGTCLASCVATLIAGLLSNLPVGCAPGVSLSAYFSYGNLI